LQRILIVVYMKYGTAPTKKKKPAKTVSAAGGAPFDMRDEFSKLAALQRRLQGDE
jgi:hypothetical protein